MWPFKKRPPEPVPVIVQAGLEAIQNGEAEYGGDFLTVKHKGHVYRFQYWSGNHNRIYNASTDWIPWPASLAGRRDVLDAVKEGEARCRREKRAQQTLCLEQISKNTLSDENA